MDKELEPIPDTQDISDQTPEQSREIIEKLPPKRQRKVRQTRGRLMEGSYVVADKIVDDKTAEGVMVVINKEE